MSKAPIGALVRIYYDGATVLEGEALRTPTGRIYVVVNRRVQKRGEHVGRQHLGCVVAKEPPPDASDSLVSTMRRREWGTPLGSIGVEFLELVDDATVVAFWLWVLQELLRLFV